MSRDKMDKLAGWGRKLSLAGLVLLLGGTAVFRLGLMDFRPPFLALVLGAVLALVALGLSLVVLLRQGDRNVKGKARITILISVLVLFFPLSAVISGGDAPVIHDITTDTDNPPVFKEMPNVRAAGDNTLAIKPDVIEIQKQAYPDIGPLFTDVPRPILYAKVLELVADSGWDLISADNRLGEVEAVATTPAFGFKDDVIIRISPDADGLRVDMRSVSRAGQGDLGANAKRIKRFLTQLDLSLQQ
ncbi:MAG: DUF1499 domain-containing protein [Parvibaculales bacterium]